MSQKENFKVVRPHLGDKWYDKGDTRSARRDTVKHLVKSGTLAEPDDDATDDEADSENKATGAVETKPAPSSVKSKDQAAAKK